MKNSALVLIDIQNGFAESDWWGIRNNPRFETNVSRILSHVREKSLAVVHVQHVSRRKNSPLRPDQAGVEFMRCAEPTAGETIVQKSVNSAFIGTNFQEILTHRNINHLVIIGLTTDHCVSTTARMAANLGFDVTILADATACFPRSDMDGVSIPADDVQRISLASLKGEFAAVKTVEKFISEEDSP